MHAFWYEVAFIALMKIDKSPFTKDIIKVKIVDKEKSPYGLIPTKANGAAGRAYCISIPAAHCSIFFLFGFYISILIFILFAASSGSSAAVIGLPITKIVAPFSIACCGVATLF